MNENGFGDLHRNDRGAAMWLAENWAEVQQADAPPGLSHPRWIKEWLAEQVKDTPPTPALAFEAPARLTASIEQVAPVAHKVNKLASMAERGEGQEKATAQKYLDKKAKQMGMETEELVSLSAKLEPARTVPANSMDVLEDTMKDALEIAVELADYIRGTQTTTGATPLSREFTLALVIKALDARGVQ